MLGATNWIIFHVIITKKYRNKSNWLWCWSQQYIYIIFIFYGIIQHIQIQWASSDLGKLLYKNPKKLVWRNVFTDLNCPDNPTRVPSF